MCNIIHKVAVPPFGKKQWKQNGTMWLVGYFMGVYKPGSIVPPLSNLARYLSSSRFNKMSIHVDHPPIFRLNADIFMQILEINGDMFTANEDALNTTRITSQVCRTWRDFMLNESSLWAHLIDFDHLETLQSTEWGLELIRRSGSMPLWIRATNDLMLLQLPSEHRRKFFLRVMRENWNRIHKLLLNGLLLLQIGMWGGPFTAPAPVLKMFHVMFVNSFSRWTTIWKDQSTGPFLSPPFVGTLFYNSLS